VICLMLWRCCHDQPAVLHPKYLDFADHYGFTITVMRNDHTHMLDNQLQELGLVFMQEQYRSHAEQAAKEGVDLRIRFFWGWYGE